MTLSGPAGTALRLAVPVVLLALLWHGFDGRAAVRRLAAAQPGWLVMAFALVHAQTLLSALRWRLVASRLGQGIARGEAVGEYYLTQFLNQTLPGGVAGDAARAVRARRGAGLLRAGQAVAIERLAGQAALLLVTLAAFALAPLLPGGPDWPVWTAPAAGVALAMLAAGGLWLAASRRTGFAALLRDTLLSRQQAGLGLAIVACNLGSFAAAARATGTPLGPEAISTLIPAILFAMLLPVTVAGWGWREGAAAALFPLAGASAEAGIAASVAFGLVVLAAALPGALRLGWR